MVPRKKLIDVEAELDKLARERKTLEQDLQRVRGRAARRSEGSSFFAKKVQFVHLLFILRQVK